MRLDKTAIAILSVTALAWSIPFAQSAESQQSGALHPQADSAGFARLDANRDGYLSFGEIKHSDEYHKPFLEADADRDGRLNGTEVIKAHQLYERALAARYAADAWITAKVKTALLREKGLDSFDVSVETFEKEVLLSGFVDDAEQKRKALLVASGVSGVQDVKDGLAVRK
jgi:hyperosmotically inducible protein